MNVVHFLEQAGHYISFAVRALPAALAALLRPGVLLVQLYSVLLGALPLGFVTGMALGFVVWIHLHGAIEFPGLQERVPTYLALAVVVEFAPLGAGLIVAGRTGASLGAELGSMKLTEQIDALEVLGQSPMLKLVGPRVMACMIALPVLTVLIAYISIGSSFLAEKLGGTMSWLQYREACMAQLTLRHAVPAVAKTVIFGFLVGVTGCYAGMTTAGGTEGVGKAATQGVVVSIFVVMISNVVMVKLIQMLF